MPKDWIVHEKTIAKIERSFRFYRDAGDSKKSSMEKSLRMFGNWQTRSLLNPRSNGRHGGNADEAREILLAELERILEE